MKRRAFIATAALPAAAAPASQPRPLKPNQWGPSFYDTAEQQQLTEVLESGNPFRWYADAGASKALAFEKEFAARMQTKYALAVTSGTAALQCAVAALEIGPGDEVILPAWTWHSCANAVVLAGALPVFAEIDESFNIDPADIGRRITPQTKLIMAVHLQGNPCAIDRVVEIARRHRLRLLEDCAQSVGASFRGRPLGSFGDIGIYSLQQNKTITAGEGGAVVTSDPALFERAARFHDMGMVRAPHQAMLGQTKLDPFVGANYRMNEFSAGVLLAQVRKMDGMIRAARGHAARIVDGIRDLPGLELRRQPDPAGDMGAGVFLGFRGKEERDAFIAAMKAEGVAAGPPGGSVVLPLQAHIIAKRTIHPAWPTWNTPRGRAIEYGPESCPKTIAVLNRFAGVLVHPKYGRADTDRIISAIRKSYAAVRQA